LKSQESSYLDHLYELGVGTPIDMVTAAKLYMASAAQHNFVSEYRLGRLYQNGTGVAQNYGAAYIWFHEAATLPI
jgi:TPR repeat protein